MNVLYVALTTENGALQILRLFCPNLAPADLLTGGQLFAVLRLVYHVLDGKDVDKGLVFVQGECHPQRLSASCTPYFPFIIREEVHSVTTHTLCGKQVSSRPSVICYQ